MKITLLNANPADESFDRYLGSCIEAFEGRQHTVKTHVLRDLDIKYCTGCWTCWWKTPGRCVFADDMEKIYRDTVASDLLIFAAPLVMGFPSALLKKTQDRLIPLLLSYMEIDHDEFHHRKRYASYPRVGVIVMPEDDTDEEDLKIVKDMMERFTINFKSDLAFFTTTGTRPGEYKI